MRWTRREERADRYWRRSNNGLLTMIIEHEAAGTLLKSTENRAGGFTCRINFYLVSSLTVHHPRFVSTHLLRYALYRTVTGFPAHRLLFPRIPYRNHFCRLFLLNSFSLFEKHLLRGSFEEHFYLSTVHSVVSF